MPACKPLRRPALDDDPRLSTSLTPAKAQELYYYLRLTRSLEDMLARLYRQSKVFGGLYSSLGQEAVSVGAACALEPGDWIAPMIRNIGALLVRGIQPREILMQLMAREGSPTHGKDGTCHMADLTDRHIVAPMSMLGDLISDHDRSGHGRPLPRPQDRHHDLDRRRRHLHRRLSRRHEPGRRAERRHWWSSSKTISGPTRRPSRARSRCAISPTAPAPTASPATSWTATTSPPCCRSREQAVAQARAGNGPVLIEAKTMRMSGHAQHDPAEYVPREMMEYWKARDPLERCRACLTQNKLWDADTQAALDARVERELAAGAGRRRSLAVPAAGNRRAGRVLRRLPHHRSPAGSAPRKK